MSDMVAISNAAADAAGIPRQLLLACGIAESNLRTDARRPKDPAKDAASWPDVSGGAWQQTVRYDPSYRGGSDYPGPDEVERVLALQYDPVRSAKVAAENLAQKWAMYKPDLFKALCAYNWPGGGGRPYSAAHEQNYRRGLAEAERMAGAADTGASLKLSDVLARARSRIGDPYVWGGKKPGGMDCSGFVSWAYNGAVPSFTDAILAPTVRVEKPAPGDIVLYEYKDEEQPGVRFPHVGLFLSDGVTLDARYGYGVGEHQQLDRSRATRYYRRLPGVTVDTDGSAPPPGIGTGPSAANDEDTIIGLRRAVAHLADVVVPKAAAAAAEREAALAEAARIRQEFVGVKP